MDHLQLDLGASFLYTAANSYARTAPLMDAAPHGTFQLDHAKCPSLTVH